MFSDIIGNDKLKKELIHSVEINKTSHSYLFIGTEGIGKKLIAEEFAKMLLAVKDTENSPDFSIIEPDGNSIKIEQIREFQKKVSEKPIISDEQIQKYLQDNHQTEINSKIMLEACQGSIGKALEIKDKQELYQNTEQVVNSLERKDKIDILNMSDFIYKSKDDKLEILNYMNVLFINLAKINSKYADCIAIVEETKRRLQSNANYDMCIDNLLLSLWENVNY